MKFKFSSVWPFRMKPLKKYFPEENESFSTAYKSILTKNHQSSKNNISLAITTCQTPSNHRVDDKTCTCFVQRLAESRAMQRDELCIYLFKKRWKTIHLKCARVKVRRFFIETMTLSGMSGAIDCFCLHLDTI